MKLLVIIVTYNAMQWAERCFKSLQTSTIVPDVFVVDNGSSDGTQAYIQEYYPQTIFQQSKENLGFGAANNIGLKYALDNNYEYVYLLNQDAWIMSDTFEKLIEISQKHPEYGLISPMQMNADLYHIDKNFCNGLFDYQNKEVINDIYNNNLKDIYETTPFVMAAHWFLTRRCIEKVGLFSPTFKHYGEDCNFADRVLFHKFKIGVSPQLKVVHDRGERIDSPQKIMYMEYLNYVCVFSNPLNTRYFASFAKMIAVFVKHTIEYKSLRTILYFYRLLFNLPQILKNKKISIFTHCAFYK